jgi:DNA-binding NarL/FixJ family response regulator
VTAMAAAVARAGNPAWADATLAWWSVQRAVATTDSALATLAAADLATLAAEDDRFALRAGAALVWSSILTSTVDPTAALASAEALARTGHVWEAAALCGAAAATLSDPAATKDLLSAGRALRATITPTGEHRTGLSKREVSVGELLIDGLTQKEIGARLYISPKTVEQHVARLRQKLMAGNRAELIAALRTRLA